MRRGKDEETGIVPGDQPRKQPFTRPTQRPAVMEGEPGRPRRGGSPPFYPGDPPDQEPMGGVKDLAAIARRGVTDDGSGMLSAGAGTRPHFDDGTGPPPDDFGASLSDDQVGMIRRRRGLPPLGADVAAASDGGPDGGPQREPGMDVRPIAQAVLRRNGPRVAAELQRRRLQRRDAFRRYGAVPTGQDPNAPPPPIRPGRPMYNAFNGRWTR